MPYLTKENIALVEKLTKGEPHFVFFPKDYKEGMRYNFDYTFEFFKMFLMQKSQNLK